ncbi:hypothetical protein OG2516_08117 [Oceanicola granulosus HTCC2516]|uniref:Uncharacterized protein n=1 Tax=Oceanicola granulosus (strain ATCC BAA-861 / DSM 15982 / KCTC 12143 / HTCC2516) TaxID=314256 RepID=Q2CI31_OCEGH|nr:hypothetical protein [Oceanicola granulosus]EAR52427.1 hypothetical protein OG2516_08117 [Oceanicola granulosus HTCC2516]
MRHTILPRLVALALALALPAPAAAQDISAALAADGLAATETRLAALTEPSPEERFALGGVRLLRSVERALQLRYRHGLSPELALVPVLRLPIPPNPAPEPFRPEAVEEMFTAIDADLAAAIETLAPIGDDTELGLVIDLADIWFDIDANGSRGWGEGLADVTFFYLGFGDATAITPPSVRFDTADAAWLAAYAHLLSAVSNIVLALSPTDAITEVTEATAGFAAINAETGEVAVWDEQVGTAVDLVAILLSAIEQQPDPAHSRAALAHLEAMIGHNRTFWTRVAQERDNDREWIPNKTQVSAMGLPFPPETGPAWLSVLDEGERALKGELLIPYWRLGPGAGLNLRRILTDPPEIDIIALIQGSALLPYVERGPLMRGSSLARFRTLGGGDAALYAVVLN